MSYQTIYMNSINYYLRRIYIKLSIKYNHLIDVWDAIRATEYFYEGYSPTLQVGYKYPVQQMDIMNLEILY